MGRGTGTYNPYTPDAGTRPPVLSGRDGETARMQRLIAQLSAGGTHKHVLITGLRGVGKTVLLNEFEDMCQAAGWPAAETNEIRDQTDIGTLIGGLGRKAMLQMSARKRAGERLQQAMSVLAAFELTLPGGVSFRLDVQPAVGIADSGDLVQDLRDVLLAVGSAVQEAGTGFALILDELHNLSSSDYEALIMALHRVNQKRLPVAFVGAGLPLIPELTSEAKSYAERMFEYAKLGALADADAADALARPAENQDIRWEPGAIAVALKHTAGYPYFIQEFGRCAWDQGAERSISEEAASAVRPVVDAYLDDNFFAPRMHRITKTQAQYVGAMGERGEGPYATSHIAAKLEKKVQALSWVRDDLIKSAIIYAPDVGLVDFTVPHCAQYVRRAYPLIPPDSAPSGN
jgi:hypothetical protein